MVATSDSQPSDKASCIIIHTDGSCLGNPGPGGFGALIQRLDGDRVVQEKTISGNEAETTNNRMELTAAIEALKRIKKYRSVPITVRTDSRYLVDAMTKWLPNWVANGWRKANKRPVENRDLLEQLWAFEQALNITWEWVRGHSGDPRNEEVDKLAHREAMKAKNAN